MAENRLSQEVVEVVRTSTDAHAILSQEAIEVVRTSTDANAVLSQIVVEVVRQRFGRRPQIIRMTAP